MDYYEEGSTVARNEGDKILPSPTKCNQSLKIARQKKLSLILKWDIFESAKLQENLLESPPDVPVSEFFDDWRKTWCEKPSDQTEPDVVKSSKPKRNAKMV